MGDLDKNINQLTTLTTADFQNALNRIYASRASGSGDGAIVITELVAYLLSLVPGGGDMLKSIYDTDNSGVVDDSELVNGDTVANDPAVQSNTSKVSYTDASDVAANTAFRITPSSVINAGTNLSWDGNTLNAAGGGSSVWGAITGTLSNQTDLQTELNAKQNTINNSDDISEGSTNLFLTTTERSNISANNAKVSYDDAAAVALNTTHRSSDGKNHADVVTNNAKVSNVSTNLSFTRDATTVTVQSSDGDNAVLPEANTTNAGVLGSGKWDEIVANTAKVTNANHTGDVTGSTALTIANGAVDIAHLSASGTPSSSTFLRGDNAWSVPAGAGDVSKVGTPVNNQIGVWTGDGTLEGEADITYDGTTLDVANNLKVNGQATGGDSTISFSATASFNFNNGNSNKMILTGNLTSLSVTQKVDGGSYLIYLKQDATGGRTIPTPDSSFGTKTDNSADFVTASNAVNIINVNVDPDGDTFYTVETITP